MIKVNQLSCSSVLQQKLVFMHVSKLWSSTASDDYQYIQRSKVPTLHFQKSLPRLPIPKLEDTCRRYLAAQEPLLSESDFNKTKKLTFDFRDGVGKRLQEQLKASDAENKHTSYISEPWFDMYLRDRVPLPLNYNPAIIIVNDERPGYSSQLVRSTNLLISSIRFMKSLKEGILEPEVFHLNPKKSDTDFFRLVTGALPSAVSWYGAYLFKAFPLDMSQYNGLFNSTRLPKPEKDRIYRDPTAKHILVMKGGHFYIFDVLDKDGNLLPPSDILACMKYIIEDTTPPSQHPVGILTAADRDTWTDVRDHLTRLGNEAVLNKIDSAIFNLVLDDIAIEDRINFMIHHFLHGDGTNRWFDKSFSLIISKDGVAGINMEHSWGDGVAVLRYLQDIQKDTAKNSFVHPDMEPSNYNVDTQVTMLNFKIDKYVKDSIVKVKNNYKSVCDSLIIDHVKFPEYGRKICKKHQVSPDSIMQLGFQVAFHRLHGKYVSTYESCSTAAFKHGRTETLRPCTVATRKFCDALNSSNRPSNSELKAMLQKCSEIHGNLTKEAAMGQGFDRHLFGLKKMAEKNSQKSLPAFYEDPAYHAINYNILSTSTLNSLSVMAGGFAPVVQDGFGVAYTILDDMLGAVTTSYSPKQNSRDFIDSLSFAFKEIFSVLNAAK